MLKMEKQNASITFRVPSTPSQVGVVHSALKEFLKEQIITGSAKRRISVIVRELLTNAMRHGNRNSPGRFVFVQVERLSGKEFEIVVEDEGEGFDHRLLDLRLSDEPRKIRNRGYVLIDRLSRRLEFNEKGNRVRVLVSDD